MLRFYYYNNQRSFLESPQSLKQTSGFPKEHPLKKKKKTELQLMQPEKNLHPLLENKTLFKNKQEENKKEV